MAMMKPWPQWFFLGVGIFFAGLPLVGIMAVIFLFSALGAGPMHKPPDPKFITIVHHTWFAGTYLTRWAMDYTFFGGPLPPEGSKTIQDSNQKLIWEHYWKEKNRRKLAYNLAWAASPLFFGAIFAAGGTCLIFFRKLGQQR
jgi:hypothetical protein